MGKIRFQTYFGVPIPPFKEEKLGAGSYTIRFILTGKTPSKKNNQMSVAVRKFAIAVNWHDQQYKKYLNSKNMEKKLYYQLSSSDGEGGTMELSGCLEWIKGDIDSNYNKPEDELPEYTLTPVWLTDEEYDALPEQ